MFCTYLRVTRFLKGREIFKNLFLGSPLKKFENPWLKGQNEDQQLLGQNVDPWNKICKLKRIFDKIDSNLEHSFVYQQHQSTDEDIIGFKNLSLLFVFLFENKNQFLVQSMQMKKPWSAKKSFSKVREMKIWTSSWKSILPPFRKKVPFKNIFFDVKCNQILSKVIFFSQHEFFFGMEEIWEKGKEGLFLFHAFVFYQVIPIWSKTKLPYAVYACIYMYSHGLQCWCNQLRQGFSNLFCWQP